MASTSPMAFASCRAGFSAVAVSFLPLYQWPEAKSRGRLFVRACLLLLLELLELLGLEGGSEDRYAW